MKTKSNILIIGISILTICPAFLFAQQKSGKINLVIRETSLGKIHSGAMLESLIVSPSNSRCAYVARHDGKQIVVADGMEGKEYVGIWDLAFAPKTERLAFLAALAPDQFVVVMNGKEGSPHTAIGQQTLTISPNGEHIAYMVWQEKKIIVIADGVPGKEYDSMRKGSLQFTPDSKAVAFLAGSGGKQFIVVGDTEGKPYDAVWDLTFSPDSKRVAFVAVDAADGKYFVVTDGKSGKKFDGVANLIPVFSPDGRRLAYLVLVGDRDTLVIDEVQVKQQVYHSPIFSPDGTRVAYVAEEGERCFVVLDGKELKDYPGVPFKGLTFSPDSRRFAYAATTAYKSKAGERYGIKTIEQEAQKMLLVVDGKEENEFESVTKALFSPDSKRVAYGARQDGKWFVVVDGIKGKEYEEIGPLIFSPDSKRVAYEACRSGKWLFVVDGVEGKKYDAFRHGGEIIFDSLNVLRVLAIRDDEIYRIEVEVVEK